MQKFNRFSDKLVLVTLILFLSFFLAFGIYWMLKDNIFILEIVIAVAVVIVLIKMSVKLLLSKDNKDE